jgi:pimeloyl-ACP methyl ester carboxylesterase
VPARVWRAAFRGFLDTPDFTKELAALGAPTLIAWGDRDTFTSLADQEWLQQVIPHSRRLVYAGAGHAFHWEDPDRFAADLVEFVYERRVAANALSA